MRTIVYNVKLHQDENGHWSAECENPLLPGFAGTERAGVIWNVYKVIFEDMLELNKNRGLGDSLELRVNLIEPEETGAA